MTYDELVKTVSEIHNNSDIITKGLTLVYSLSEKNHRQMNEEVFYKINPPHANPVLTDIFEVQIGEILVKFVKNKSNEEA